MAKKCIRCGVPLSGLFAKVSALAGVRPSDKNEEYCNKCESYIPAPKPPEAEKQEEPKDLYEEVSAPQNEEVVNLSEASSKVVEPTNVSENIELNKDQVEDIFEGTDK